MAEKIGLEAVFDLKNFHAGLSGYTSGLGKADKATGSFVGSAGKAWGNLSSTITKATAVMGVAVVAAAAAAGAAIGSFVVSGINKAADLEQGLSRIAAALNITKEQAGPLKDLISQLGLDPKLKVSAVEAAEAIENLAKNGLSMEQILNGAARATVLLANATGADFGQAADIATDVMQQFNFTAEEMSKVVDGITAVTNLSKFSIDDYALAIAQAGGVASSLGVSFDDFNTSIVATSALFASGSDAGTSFKTFLQRLVPQTKGASKAMKELGLDFFDAQGQMKSMADISTELNEAFFQEVTFTTEVNNATQEQIATKKMLESQISKTNMELYKYEIGLNGVAQSEEDKVVSVDRLNRQHDAAISAYENLAIAQGTTISTTRKLTEEEKTKYLTTLFGTDAMRTAISLAEAGTVVYTDQAKAATELGVSINDVAKVAEGGITQFEALALQMAKIDAEEQAATRMANFRGVMEILSGVVESIQIQIGDLFLPILTQLATKFTELASTHGPAIVAFFQSLSSDLSALANWISAVVEDGDTMNDWLTHMSPPLYAVVRGVDEFVLAMMGIADLIANSIGRFVEWKDVLIVLGAAILSVVIPAIAGMLAAMAPVILIFGAAVLAVAGLRTAWETNFLGIQDITKTAMDAVKAAIGPTMTALTEISEQVLPLFQQHWKELAAAVGGFAAVLLVAQIPALIGGIGAAATAAGVALAALNLPLLAVAAAVALLAAAWTGNWFGMRDSVTNAVSSMLTAIQPLTDAIKEFGSGALEEIKAFATGNETEWTNVKAIWDGAKESGSNLFTGIADFAKSTLPVWTANLTEWGTAAGQWILDAAGQVAAKLDEWYTNLKTTVDNKLPAWKSTLLTWKDAAWQWIADAAGEVATKLGEWYTNLKTAIDNKLPALQSTLLLWRDAAWQWIVDAAGLVGAKLTEWYTSLKTTVDNNLPAWKSTLLLWRDAAWQWVLDAAGQVGAKLTEWYSQLKITVDNKLAAWKSTLLTWRDAAWQWILDAAGLVGAKLGEWYANLKTAIDSRLTTWRDTLAIWATAAWQWIVDAAGLVATKFTEWYTNLKTTIDNKLPAWKATLIIWRDAAWQWIIDASKLVGAKLAEWYKAVSGFLTTNLPIFTTKLLEWATALVGWISSTVANALPHLGTWLGKIAAWIPLASVALTVNFLRFATALVGWISGAVANALPHLGTWLGKIVAWIPLGVLILAGAVVQLAGALIGWIADGGPQSAASKIGPEFIKFSVALINGISAVWAGFKGFVQNFATSFWNTINEHVDWHALGRGIIDKVRMGFEGLVERVYSAVRTFVGNIVANLDLDSWIAHGRKILDNIKKGFDSLITTFLTAVSTFVTDMVAKFTEIDWFQLGKDIIDGILDGLKENGQLIIDYIVGLGQDALDAITGLFRSDSPSKVMMQLGRDIIEGWLIGMQRTAPQLYQAIRDIAQNVLGGFESLSGVAGNFGSAGGGFASSLQAQIAAITGVEDGPDASQQAIADALQAKLDAFNQQKESADLLKDQADLFALVKRQGGDLAALFGNITVGMAGNAGDFLNIISGAMRFLNERTDDALQVALLGYDKIIAQMQGKREKVADVEESFNEDRLDQIEQYKDFILRLDEEIATAETDLLTGGTNEQLKRLQALEDTRRKAIAGLRTYLAQLQQIEKVAAQEQANDPILSALLNRRDALMARFKDVNAAEQERVDILREYTGIVSQLASLQRKMDQTSGLEQQVSFLQKVKDLGAEVGDTDLLRRVFLGVNPNTRMTDEKWTTVFERFTTESLGVAQKQLTKTLEEINKQIIVYGMGYDKQIERMRQTRQTAEQIEEQFQSQNLRGLESYHKRIAALDKQIADTEQKVLESGDLGQFTLLTQYNKSRQTLINDLNSFLFQQRTLDQQMATIQTSTNDRAQKEIERYREVSLDPLIEQFNHPSMNAGMRGVVMESINERIRLINVYAASVDRMAAIEQRVADFLDKEDFGIAVETAVTQAVDALYDLNTSAVDREKILSNLISYIGRAEVAFESFNRVAGDDPLLGKLKDSVRPILQGLLDINQTTAERLRLQGLYNTAIFNMMRIEGKQGQLKNLQERLDLIQQVKTLATEAKSTTLFGRVFAGLDPTKDLTPDQLATVLSRYTDEAIRLANTQLTESIKPKVDLKPQLDALAKQRETIEQIQDDFEGPIYSQLERFKSLLNFYDGLIAKGEAEALETGNAGILNTIKTWMTGRQAIVDQTRIFLRQVDQAENMIARIATTADSQGAEAAQRFQDRYIDPLFNLLDSFGSEGTRNNVLMQINTNVSALNRFIGQINRLAAVQKSREAPLSPQDAALDRFYNPAAAEADREAIIRYFSLVKTLESVQKDVSAGRSINPLVDRFATERMDKLLAQFYDLNTSEAQRLAIIQQYRMEQEKIVVLQQKQQQLEFLNQQLALVKQIEQMNQDFDSLISMENLLSGITFGINASLDDMLLLTSRTIDAMIATVKSQLKIASPSKVMAKIGEYMMQGLGQGITNGMQYPSMALAGVGQQVPYSMTNNRSTNVYMGGVAINNGMDDVMFEARVRQIIDDRLN